MNIYAELSFHARCYDLLYEMNTRRRVLLLKEITAVVKVEIAKNKEFHPIQMFDWLISFRMMVENFRILKNTAKEKIQGKVLLMRFQLNKQI